MFTPESRIGGLQLRDGCGHLQGALASLQAVVSSEALLCIFHQNNLGSKFLIENCICVTSSNSELDWPVFSNFNSKHTAENNIFLY